MEINNSSYLYIPITVNCVIVGMEAVALVASTYKMGGKSYMYYTILSNILAGISSGILVYFLNRKLKYNTPIPRLLLIVRLLAATCLALTFLVVIFVLSWSVKKDSKGKKITAIFLIFCDSNLIQHLLGPIFTCLSFMLWEVDYIMPIKYIFLPLIPTFIYGAVLVPLNAAGIVDGPYPFLKVRKQSVGISFLWAFIIIGINIGISYLIVFLTNLFKKKFPNLMKINESEPMDIDINEQIEKD